VEIPVTVAFLLADTADGRSSSSRSARDAVIDDIIDIFDALEAPSGVTFAAVNLDNLPKYGPYEINVAHVVERQTRVESTLNDIAAKMQLNCPRHDRRRSLPTKTRQRRLRWRCRICSENLTLSAHRSTHDWTSLALSVARYRTLIVDSSLPVITDNLTRRIGSLILLCSECRKIATLWCGATRQTMLCTLSLNNLLILLICSA
jgi:hypothetical protein